MSAPSVTRAAFALRTEFFVMGVLFATWGVHVPTVKAHYGLGEQALALAMLASGVGALGALAYGMARLADPVDLRPWPQAEQLPPLLWLALIRMLQTARRWLQRLRQTYQSRCHSLSVQ